MRILLAGAQPFLPQAKGGAQVSTDEIGRELSKRGHKVAVLAGLSSSGIVGLASRIELKLLGRGAAQDQVCGYTVYRAWFAEQAVPYVVGRFRPDVAIVPTSKIMPVARALSSQRVPTILYLRDVEVAEMKGELRPELFAGFIANSEFTASFFASLLGMKARVVRPLIRAERYRTRLVGRNVTFINPHPSKGLGIALAVASLLPEIPFAFVRAWDLSRAEETSLVDAVRVLPNVRLVPRTNDMRSIYREARILLVPSQWKEAWGRVVSEAQVSGIPSVASDLGGLPESVGPGGILVPSDATAEAWAEAVKRLWSNCDQWSDLSARALVYANRDEMDPVVQMDAVEAAVVEASKRFERT